MNTTSRRKPVGPRATALRTWWGETPAFGLRIHKHAATLVAGAVTGLACCSLLGAAEAAPAADVAAPRWFDFAPAPGVTNSGIDLRYLNEPVAGQNGRIVARDGRLVHRNTGQPVRFWAVNGPPHNLTGAALKACARQLARYGVNLVRVHGGVFHESTGALDPARVQHLVEVLEAMKAEGIYTHLSIYFPLWFKPQANLPWLEGYDGTQHPFAALQFNPGFQRQYQEWWRAVLTARLSNGQPLLQDPALLGLEIQNEDSFFFWTFAEKNLPEPQWRLLETQFGTWLTTRYGSVERALATWGGPPLKRDNPTDGRAGFASLYDLFTRRSPRDQDTAAFLLETQRGFYERTVRFFRDLGFDGIVLCSNWTTANQEILGPLEKYSYTVGDVLDRHGYFSCKHSGPNAEWSIRDGHTYRDRSALRFDPEEPSGKPQFNHPIIDIEYDGKPTMLSETTWNRPNRYRGEAPLFLAAYGALQDCDVLVHFAFDGADWSVKPNFWMQPWTLMAPTQFGQFPAAALLYRQGLVSEGPVLADLRLSLADLRALKGTPLPQDAAFDELRLKDVPPAGRTVQTGQRLDPLIHFAGRTRVAFVDGPGQVQLTNTQRFIHRDRSTVLSATRELELDYGHGVLRLNAPKAQGVSGALHTAPEFTLTDLTVTCPLPTAHFLAVALDNAPLARSQRILLQVMSEERTSGWETSSDNGLNRIVHIGTNPWQVRELAGSVRFRRPDATQLQVTALDLNGLPAGPHGTADLIQLRPDTLYYLIEPRAK